MSSPFDTFHPFPRLPIELRDHVWTLSLPGKRLLAPQIQPQNYYRIVPRRPSGVEVKSDPIALQVNHESRVIALRHYQKIERSNSALYQYVDFKVDTINLKYIMLHRVARMTRRNTADGNEQIDAECYLERLGFSATELSKITSLDIEFKERRWSGDHVADFLCGWLRSFPGLKDLRCITYDMDPGDILPGSRNDYHSEVLNLSDLLRKYFQRHTKRILEEQGITWQHPTVALIRKKWDAGISSDTSTYTFPCYEIKVDTTTVCN